VATLVKFLASEGTYITGEVIRLDGGRSVVW
jgi:NAD(P)-dependent dehydrogenase (short-subunit alcohol dehydrogenase family)